MYQAVFLCDPLLVNAIDTQPNFFIFVRVLASICFACFVLFLSLKLIVRYFDNLSRDFDNQTLI